MTVRLRAINRIARIAIVALGAAALATHVSADEVPAFNWTGFYAGVNAGAGWGNNVTTTETLLDIFGETDTQSQTSALKAGWLGGLQGGLNWQFASRWVLGAEADIQATGQKSQAEYRCPPSGTQCGLFLFNSNGGFIERFTGTPVTTTIVHKLPWFGTVRARLGVNPAPTMLLYVTGGLAYGNVNTDVTVSGRGTSTSYSNNPIKTGWTLGAGFEALIASNWTIKAEYLYMDLGEVSAGPVLTTQVLLLGGAITSSFDTSRFRDHIVRIGLNYQFGYRPSAR